MKYCEYCGKAIGDNAAFCSGCGKSCKSVSATPAQTFCENCGRPLAADERFCQGCGKPVGGQTAPVFAAPVQAVPVQAAPVPAAPAQVVPVQPVPVPVAPVPTAPAQPAAQPIPQPMPQPAAQFVPQPAPVPQMPVQPETAASAPAAAKKRKMPKWVLAVTAAVLVAAIGLGIFALCGGFIKRADLPNPLTLENLTGFFEVVIENADGDYVCLTTGEGNYWVNLADPNVSKDSMLYVPSMVQIRVRDLLNGKIKLDDGYVSIHVPTGGDLIGKDYPEYSEEQYDRTRDVITALEKTLAGKTEADNYLKSYSEMQKQAATMGTGIDGAMQIDYWLNEKLECSIMISRSSSGWTVSYNIKVRP